MKLPRKAQAYVQDLISYSSDKGLVSAYLFGSVGSKSFGPLSDVDVLLIMDDKLSLKDLHNLSSQIKKIEIKHGYRKPDSSYIDDKLSIGFCHYLWRESDFMKLDTSKFSASSFLSEIFAPRSILLNSILSEIKLIYGKKLKLPKAEKITAFDLFRNFFVNFCLSLVAFPMALIRRDYVKYSLTAIKWSLYGCATYLGVKKGKDLKHLATKLLPKNYASSIFSIRQNGTSNVIFSLITVWHVIKLHVFTLLNRGDYKR